MKISLQLSFFLLFFCGTEAQSVKSVPGFGKVEKSELEMTVCPFEKNAGAMVIFDEGESVFRIELNAAVPYVFQQTEFRIRIKIFNKKGFDQANIKIHYRNDKDVFIKNLSAQTYNLDANGNIVVTKVDKAAVYTKELNKRYSEKIFAFPDIKEGSVIEYKYVLDGASADHWYFQHSIPVQLSRFIINFPTEVIVGAIPHCSLPLQRGKEDKGVGNYLWYAMENLPSLTDEPYMANRDDYLQRMDIVLTALDFPGQRRISLLPTWRGIVKELIDDEDFGRQLKKDIPRTSDLDKMLVAETSPLKKMKIIHKYVRDNMEWNERESIWALEGVKSAWKNKKGTSGEINLVLINLLKDAGLTVRPVLVSTRENGIVNTAMPGNDQFNKVMAYVEIGDSYYVLDATEKSTPSQMVPLNVMASEGLVIEKPDNMEWGWKTLWDDEHKFSSSIIINAELDGTKMLKGSARITAYDYKKIALLDILKKGKKELQESNISEDGIIIDSFEVEGATVDTVPLVEIFDFTKPVSSSGVYHYFSANLFAGLNKNPFIADERASDIFFGAGQDYTINTNIYLPEGYVMDALPKNVKMINADTSIAFMRYSSYNDGILNVQYSLKFSRPFYPVDTYGDLKEFYKKLYEMLNEKFVYKKK